jgi:hypothetical protein
MKKIKGRYTLMYNNKPVKFKVDINDITNIDINKYEYFESKGVSSYFSLRRRFTGYIEYTIDVLYDKRYVESLLQNLYYINAKFEYYLDLDTEKQLTVDEIDILKSLGKLSKDKKTICFVFNIDTMKKKWQLDEVNWNATSEIEIMEIDVIENKIFIADTNYLNELLEK